MGWALFLQVFEWNSVSMQKYFLMIAGTSYHVVNKKKKKKIKIPNLSEWWFQFPLALSLFK